MAAQTPSKMIRRVTTVEEYVPDELERDDRDEGREPDEDEVEEDEGDEHESRPLKRRR